MADSFGRRRGLSARWFVGTGELGCGVWRWGSAGEMGGVGPDAGGPAEPRWDGCGTPRLGEFGRRLAVNEGGERAVSAAW